jgi:hypothetical protein
MSMDNGYQSKTTKGLRKCGIWIAAKPKGRGRRASEDLKCRMSNEGYAE